MSRATLLRSSVVWYIGAGQSGPFCLEIDVSAISDAQIRESLKILREIAQVRSSVVAEGLKQQLIEALNARMIAITSQTSLPLSTAAVDSAGQADAARQGGPSPRQRG